MGGARRGRRAGLQRELLQPGRARARARGSRSRIGYLRADHSLSMNGQDSGVDPVKGLVGGRRGAGQALRRSRSRSGSASTCPTTACRACARCRRTSRAGSSTTTATSASTSRANLAVSPRPWLQIGGGVVVHGGDRRRPSTSAGNVDILKPDDSPLRNSGQRRPDRDPLPAGRRARRAQQAPRARARLPRAVPARPRPQGATSRGDICRRRGTSRPRSSSCRPTAWTRSCRSRWSLGGSWKPHRRSARRPRPHLGQLERVRPAGRAICSQLEHPAARGRVARRHQAADEARAHRPSCPSR